MNIVLTKKQVDAILTAGDRMLIQYVKAVIHPVKRDEKGRIKAAAEQVALDAVSMMEEAFSPLRQARRKKGKRG